MGTPAGVTKGVGVGIPRWSEFLKKITSAIYWVPCLAPTWQEGTSSS